MAGNSRLGGDPKDYDGGVTSQPPDPPRGPTFEERMERFGQQAEEAGKRLGRETEGAARRLAADPSVARAGDTGARLWGLFVIAVGLWFFAQVTMGYDMPAVPWGEVWPLGLIVVGLFVIARGLTRRGG
jgi:hypothetical protein